MIMSVTTIIKMGMMIKTIDDGQNDDCNDVNDDGDDFEDHDGKYIGDNVVTVTGLPVDELSFCYCRGCCCCCCYCYCCCCLYYYDPSSPSSLLLRERSQTSLLFSRSAVLRCDCFSWCCCCLRILLLTRAQDGGRLVATFLSPSRLRTTTTTGFSFCGEVFQGCSPIFL